MAESECLAEFRFKERDIYLLAELLKGNSANHTMWSKIDLWWDRGLMHAVEAAIIPLQRFARPVPVISMITNILIDYISEIHSRRITHWNREILDADHLEMYAAAITSRDSPLHNCFGFIDGTVRPIARPGENQRILYNGQKWVHAIKFQSVVLPNGLIGNMYGPLGETYSHVAVSVLLYKSDT